MGGEDYIQLSSDDIGKNDSDNDLDCEKTECDVRNNSSSNGGEEFVSVDGNEPANHLQDGKLKNEGASQQPILQESAGLIEIDTIVENTNDRETSPQKESGSVTLSTSLLESHIIDEGPRSGVKRARVEYDDKEPSVRVVFRSLTRESKLKLEDLLQQWSEWQARNSHKDNDSATENLEHGEETYFPALHVGQEKSSVVSFSMVTKVENKGNTSVAYESVPLYDRGYVLGSNAADGLVSAERSELEASRCFNCGSYSHSLKECPRPRDFAAINSARTQLSAKKNQNTSARGQARYYQISPGKFDDLKAGVLGKETRECLGIGEFDPPPWLHRMREIGYPPGYLDVQEDEDQPSGITIYAEEKTELEYEDGELPEQGEPAPPKKKMTVEFPGINAPIPENADHRQWATPPSLATRSESWSMRSQYDPSLHRGFQHDHRRSREYRDDGPPGVDMHSYSHRYSPYDLDLSSRTSNLGRSSSDRGWRNPFRHEDSSRFGPLSPPHHSGMYRQSPLQYNSPSNFERWAPDNSSLLSPNSSSQGRNRDPDRDWHFHRYHDRR